MAGFLFRFSFRFDVLLSHYRRDEAYATTGSSNTTPTVQILCLFIFVNVQKNCALSCSFLFLVLFSSFSSSSFPVVVWLHWVQQCAWVCFVVSFFVLLLLFLFSVSRLVFFHSTKISKYLPCFSFSWKILWRNFQQKKNNVRIYNTQQNKSLLYQMEKRREKNKIMNLKNVNR